MGMSHHYLSQIRRLGPLRGLCGILLPGIFLYVPALALADTEAAGTVPSAEVVQETVFTLAEFAELQTRVAQLRSDNLNLARQLVQAKAQISEFESSNTELEQRLDAAQQNMQSFRQECIHRAEVCRVESEQLLNSRTLQLEQVQEATTRLRTNNQDLTLRLDQLQLENSQFAKRQMELSQQLSIAHDELKRSGKALEVLQHEYDAEQISAEQAYTRLDQQLRQGQARVSELQAVNEDLARRLEQAQAENLQAGEYRVALEQELVSTQVAVRDCRQAHADLRANIDQEQEAATEIQADLNRQLQQAKGEADQLQAVNQDLGAQVDLSRIEQTRLRENVAGLETNLGTVLEELRQAEQALTGLRQERDVAWQQAAALKTTLQRSEGAKAALQTQFADFREQQALARQAQEQELAQAYQQMEGLNRTLSEQNSALAAMRARLPAKEGGTMTLAQARQDAETAMQRMRDSAKAAASSKTAQTRNALTQAREDLHRAQSMVARVTGARGVYRVRSGDTLAEISRRYYGVIGRWPQIHEANRHILSNPNLLVAGTTLVMP